MERERNDGLPPTYTLLEVAVLRGAEIQAALASDSRSRSPQLCSASLSPRKFKCLLVPGKFLPVRFCFVLFSEMLIFKAWLAVL